jgi:hypothetical protein
MKIMAIESALGSGSQTLLQDVREDDVIMVVGGASLLGTGTPRISALFMIMLTHGFRLIGNGNRNRRRKRGGRGT